MIAGCGLRFGTGGQGDLTVSPRDLMLIEYGWSRPESVNSTRRDFLSRAALSGGLLALKAKASPEGVGHPSDLESLRKVFLNPPESARPLTRWWWFGGAITPQEITRELTLMRNAGLGGVELQPVYPVEVDDPERGIRNTPFFTPQWFDLLRHVARETARLGLQFDLTLGSGWPFGGPFIPIELAARRLQMFRQDVDGPQRVSFAHLSGEVMEGDQVLFVLAAPLSSSGAMDVGQAKIVARHEMALYGRWQAPAGKWRVMLFVDSATRQQVKRPTIGMEGYVLDHFNREALATFLKSVGDVTLQQLRSAGPSPLHSIFSDSLEVYGADWTGAVIPEFKRRRGYDLELNMPALWEDIGPTTRHIRYDYHLTLSELAIQNFFEPLTAWSKEHHVVARVQAHGAMGDVMRGYSLADVPEGEDNPGHDRYVVNLQHRRLASSAGHVYGKPLISAETYTALRSPLFLVTLETMKAVTDGMFLDGINQIVNHGYAASPPEAGQPGWSFYASSHINHNNTWWRHYPLLTRYIRRVAALLREGTAVNPIAVYLPLADVYARHGCGSLNMDEALQQHMGLGLFTALRRAGYDFDVLNDHVVTEVAKADSGRLYAGSAEFLAVVIPECRLPPPETMASLARFARSGGLLIFLNRKPEAAPGLTNQEARTKELQAMVQDLFENRQAALVPDVEGALDHLRGRLAPDFNIISAGNTPDEMRDARENVGFAHRRLEHADLYFVSNMSPVRRDLRVSFACGHKTPELWNPETGDVCTLAAYEHVKIGFADATAVDLQLNPFEGQFVAFAPGEPSLIAQTNLRVPIEATREGPAIRLSARVAANGEYDIRRTDGKTRRFAVSGIPGPIPITGPWRVRLGETVSLTLPILKSWTDLPEGKGYSGWAIYETAFEGVDPDPALDWMIDLGVVHETADVELNGVSLGAAWKGARVLSVQKALRQGQNLLRIDIANLWIHKVLSSPPWDRRRVAEVYGERWGKPEAAVPSRLPPSGLLGPVQLVPLQRLTTTI